MTENRRMLELQEALKDFHEMNTDKQWARVCCDEYLVILYYGIIGMEEIALGQRLYVAKQGWIAMLPSVYEG